MGVTLLARAPGTGGGAGGAPVGASYVVGTADPDLTGELVLGSAVIMRGTEAARPAAALAGRIYYATDTDKLYRDDGGTWEFVASKDAAELTGAISAAVHGSPAGDLHPGYALDGDLTAHEGAADPHTGYRLEGAAIGTADLADDAVTAAKIANLERWLYIARGQHTLDDNGVGVQIGAVPNSLGGTALANALTQGVGMSAIMPADYVAGSDITIAVLTVGDGAAAADVRMRLTWSAVEVGDDSGEAGTTVNVTVAVAASAVVLAEWSFAAFTPAGLGPGDLLRIWLHRLGADAADTYTGALRWVGLKIRYEASQ